MIRPTLKKKEELSTVIKEILDKRRKFIRTRRQIILEDAQINKTVNNMVKQDINKFEEEQIIKFNGNK